MKYLKVQTGAFYTLRVPCTMPTEFVCAKSAAFQRYGDLIERHYQYSDSRGGGLEAFYRSALR